MKKLIIIILGVIFLFNPAGVKASNVFSTSLNINTSDIKVSQDFSVSIQLSGLNSLGLAAGQYYVNYDNSKLTYMGYTVGQGKPEADFSVSQNGADLIILYVDNAGGDNPLKNGTFVTLNFRAISEGIANISLSGEGFSSGGATIEDLTTNSPSRNISITKKAVEKPKEDNTNNNNTNNTNTNNNSSNKNTNNNNNNNNSNTTKEEKEEESELSNDADLKELQIEGYEIKFNRNTTEYSIEVPYETDKLEIDYEVSSNKAKVEISNKDLEVGENEIIIKVIAEDKTEKTYKIKVIRKEKEEVKELSSINLVNLINSGIDFIEVDINYDSSKVINKTIIELIKEKEVEIKFNINKDKENIYYVILNKEILKDINNELDLNINDSLNGEKINIGKSIVINLLENKKWNKDISVYYNIEALKNEKIYLYEYNNKLNLIKEETKTDGYIKLSLEEQKQYILSENKLPLKSNMLQNIIIGLIVILIIGVCFYIFYLSKRRKKVEV